MRRLSTYIAMMNFKNRNKHKQDFLDRTHHNKPKLNKRKKIKVKVLSSVKKVNNETHLRYPKEKSSKYDPYYAYYADPPQGLD